MADDLKTQLADAQAALDGEEQAAPTTDTPADEAVAQVVEDQTENPEMETLAEDTTPAAETTEEAPAEDAASSEEPVADAPTEDATPSEDQAEQSTEAPEDAANTEESTDAPADVAPVDEHPNARWYVVHTYSGHENRVAQTLKQRVEAEHLEDKIVEVLVPTQEKIEIRGGKKEQVKEKIFPGYLLVRMVMDDDSWVAVRTTQGVTSFIGMSNKPTPIPAAEVQSILKFMQQGGQPTYKQAFNDGDTVKIVDGPFTEFIGKIDNVDKDRGKVRVLVSIFGRETPVELDFLQVQKL